MAAVSHPLVETYKQEEILQDEEYPQGEENSQAEASSHGEENSQAEASSHGEENSQDEDYSQDEEYSQGEENLQGEEGSQGGETSQGEEYSQGDENPQGDENLQGGENLHDEEPGEFENTHSRSTSLHNATERVRSWESGNTISAGHYLEPINNKIVWKPATLKAPWLVCTAVCLLAWIGILKYLSQKSLRNGGIVYAFSQDDFSPAITFLTNYLPTIVAVIFSITWSWVDLDAKQLEPYFQMSKPGGASAADSVLLHYPFDFVAVVPVKAFKRRHWSVFFSSMVTAIIFWGLSPLQSALFHTITVNRTSLESGSLNGRLSSITEHAAGLNLSFVPEAYGVVWLNQTLPPFTAMDAAYIPFSIDTDSSSISLNSIVLDRTFTSRTSMLSTQIQCTSASVYNSNQCDSSECSSTGYIDGHFGCKANMSLTCSDPYDDYCFWYIGYQTNIGDSLQTMGCPANASDLYLAVVTSPELKHVTAEFCQPTYWIQDVNLTVAAPSMAVISSTPLVPPTELSLNDFDASTFQAIIWTGQLLGDYIPTMLESNGDVIDYQNVLDMSWRLSSLNIQLQGSFMAGFAVGGTKFPAEAYMERENLIFSLEKAHKLLFALAMNGLLTINRKKSAPVVVTANNSVYTISVIRPLVLVVEVLLGCAVISVFSLLFISARRPSCLLEDPASLTDVASMLESAGGDTDSSNTSSIIIHNSNGVRFSLQHIRRWNVPEWLSYRQVHQRHQPSGRIIPNEIFRRPFYLGPIAGLVLVTLLLGAIATLVTLKTLIDRCNGLLLPSNNDAVTQIVLSYIPVLFSTFLEPYWLLLNRVLCLLQPFEELRSCQAKARHSLDLRYSSLPPSLAFWRALRAKHYLLTAVCTISLLANVLTVGLGALLNPEITSYETLIDLKVESKPIFNAAGLVNPSETNDIQDFFYITESNLSANTSLPPWTSKEAYFLPVALGISHPADITINTYGFHVALSCDEAAGKNATFQYYSGSAFSFNTTVVDPNGEHIKCYFNQAAINFDDALLISGQAVTEGFETVAPLFASNPEASADQVAICSSAFSVVYQRGYVSSSPGSVVLNTTSSLYLVCQPALEIANYSVQLSQTGDVVSSIRQTQPSSNLSEYFTAPLNVSDLYFNLNQLISWVHLSGESPAWLSLPGSGARVHNDAFAYSWFPYLMSELLHSRNTVNTSTPLPSADVVIPAVSALYSQLSATILSLGNARFFPIPASNGETISASIQTPETRVFMSDSVLYVCCIILALDVIVAIVYYWHRPQHILLHMPTTIASLIYLFEGSTLVAARGKWDAKWLFGFGKFIGTDGKLRVGIERQPFVQPLPKILRQEELDPLIDWEVDENKRWRRKKPV